MPKGLHISLDVYLHQKEQFSFFLRRWLLPRVRGHGVHSIENNPATLKALGTLRTLQQALKTLLLDIVNYLSPQNSNIKQLPSAPAFPGHARFGFHF